MSKQSRVPKTLHGKLSDLDNHLFLLRDHLHRLNEGEAHFKSISGGLRVLLCFSSGTEGLLWRLVDELQISDKIYLHVARSVNTSHPLAQGLHFSIVPIQRGGLGHPQLPPSHYSFREIIKQYDGVFISGQGYTHEYIIKAIAQQMGTAHEDDAIEEPLADLKQILINGIPPYVRLLATDAELALQIGERVLDKAEAEFSYQRQPRPSNGNVTIAIRMGLNKPVNNPIPIVSVRSYISDIEISCRAFPEHLTFSVVKAGTNVKDIEAEYPPNWGMKSDAVFTLLLSSNARQVHAIVNGKSQDDGLICNIGWLEAGEITVDALPVGNIETVYRECLWIYNRLLSPDDCIELLSLRPSGYNLRTQRNVSEQTKFFPE